MHQMLAHNALTGVADFLASLLLLLRVLAGTRSCGSLATLLVVAAACRSECPACSSWPYSASSGIGNNMMRQLFSRLLQLAVDSSASILSSKLHNTQCLFL
jgi:hypothetical protein